MCWKLSVSTFIVGAIEWFNVFVLFARSNGSLLSMNASIAHPKLSCALETLSNGRNASCTTNHGVKCNATRATPSANGWTTAKVFTDWSATPLTVAAGLFFDRSLEPSWLRLQWYLLLSAVWQGCEKVRAFLNKLILRLDQCIFLFTHLADLLCLSNESLAGMSLLQWRTQIFRNSSAAFQTPLASLLSFLHYWNLRPTVTTKCLITTLREIRYPTKLVQAFCH